MLLLALPAFAQTPQDPTTPSTAALDARLRALERSAGGAGFTLRVSTGPGAYSVYTNPATLTLQADGGYLRAAGSSVLAPPWANPIVWVPAGGGSRAVFADPGTLSGDGSSASILRRLAWRGAHSTNGVLGTGLASDPLRLDPSYPGGLADAPATDGPYARQSNEWVEIDSLVPPPAPESDPVYSALGVSRAGFTLVEGTSNHWSPSNTTLTIKTNPASSGSGFPLTNNGDLATFSLTNGGVVQAHSGLFDRVTGDWEGGNVEQDVTMAKDLTILGSLLVTGYATNVKWYVLNVYTQVNMGVYTNFFTENHYQTNIVYEYQTNYTVSVTTQEVNTIVTVGGYIDASRASWSSFPMLLLSNGTATATGTWDFTSAALTGIPWGQATTNLLTNVNWTAFLTSEADTNFYAWLSADFTNSVEAIVAEASVAASSNSRSGEFPGLPAPTSSVAAIQATNHYWIIDHPPSQTMWLVKSGTNVGATVAFRAAIGSNYFAPGNWTLPAQMTANSTGTYVGHSPIGGSNWTVNYWGP